MKGSLMVVARHKNYMLCLLVAILLELTQLRRDTRFELAPGLFVAILLKLAHWDTNMRFALGLFAAILLKLGQLQC